MALDGSILVEHDPVLTIRVFYSCPACRLVKVGCDVPARGQEDVRAWMEQVGRELAQDHQRRSPRCPSRHLTDLLIPMTGATTVGGSAVQ